MTSYNVGIIIVIIINCSGFLAPINCSYKMVLLLTWGRWSSASRRHWWALWTSSLWRRGKRAPPSVSRVSGLRMCPLEAVHLTGNRRDSPVARLLQTDPRRWDVTPTYAADGSEVLASTQCTWAEGRRRLHRWFSLNSERELSKVVQKLFYRISIKFVQRSKKTNYYYTK